MQTITVDFATVSEKRHYPIHIGHGILKRIDLVLPHIPKKRVAIITNEAVAPLYLNEFAQQLEAKNIKIIPIILPDGEEHKNWQTLNLIYDTFTQKSL